MVSGGFTSPEFAGWLSLACSRLQDSGACGIEKAGTRKKYGRKLFPFSRPAPVFARAKLSRLPHYLRAWNRLGRLLL